MSAVGAVGRSFWSAREGIRCSRLPQVSQLRVKELVSTWHYWSDVFIVQKQGPGRRKVSTMISTVTCSTWRWMGSVRLYFALESPLEKSATIPWRTGRRPSYRGPRLPPYTRMEVSSMLLVYHRRFMEETTSPFTHGTQGHLEQRRYSRNLHTKCGQVQMEYHWTLWNEKEELWRNNNRGNIQGFLQWNRG